MMGADLAHAAATLAADQQAREQVARPTSIFRPDRTIGLPDPVVKNGLARLDGEPKIFVDDAEMRNRLFDHLAFVVEADNGLVGVGIGLETGAIIDEAADIERVVDYAGVAAAVAVDTRGVPSPQPIPVSGAPL